MADLSNPYRRALLMASLSEDEGEGIENLVVTAVNALGMTIQAAAGVRRPKEILQRRQKKPREQVFYLPDGRVVVVR